VSLKKPFYSHIFLRCFKNSPIDPIGEFLFFFGKMDYFMIPLGQIQTTSKTKRLRPLSFFIAVALGLFHDPCWWVIQVQKPCHFVAMAFIVLNTRLNLRFRLVQNNKSQHVVLAFEPAEREGFEPPDL
jgi:hypothetical protein